jgi:four helix bundle protein
MVGGRRLTVDGGKQKVPARNYRDLIVWQEGIDLAKAVYKLTQRLPRLEIHALSDQIRRAAVSVPSNIAEGQARKAPGDFSRFLHIALGSLAEVDTQLVLARELDYVTDRETIAIHEQILGLRKKLYALINSLPAAR